MLDAAQDGNRVCYTVLFHPIVQKGLDALDTFFIVRIMTVHVLLNGQDVVLIESCLGCF